MTQLTQSVSFEILVEMSIDCDTSTSDYGVPGSPVFNEYEYHDFADHTVTIAGVDVLVKSLPIVLQNAILESAIEACVDGNWEGYDYE